MKGRSPNSNCMVAKFMRDLILNFHFEIEYRTTVLSRGTHLINLGCQSASFEMTFMLERHFLHSQITCALSYLLRVGWSCVRSDNPAISACLSLVAVRLSDLTPDDPNLGFCERLSASERGRMIRPHAGWSGPGSFTSVFCLFCYPLGWSGVCLDDPVPPENTHNGHVWGWEYIYPFTPFIYLSLPPRPTTPP